MTADAAPAGWTLERGRSLVSDKRYVDFRQRCLLKMTNAAALHCVIRLARVAASAAKLQALCTFSQVTSTRMNFSQGVRALWRGGVSIGKARTFFVNAVRQSLSYQNIAATMKISFFCKLAKTVMLSLELSAYGPTIRLELAYAVSCFKRYLVLKEVPARGLAVSRAEQQLHCKLRFNVL